MPNTRNKKPSRAASLAEERRDAHLKRAIASRLRPALHRELMRTARSEQRTMSTYIEMVLEDHFRAKRLIKTMRSTTAPDLMEDIVQPRQAVGS